MSLAHTMTNLVAVVQRLDSAIQRMNHHLLIKDYQHTINKQIPCCRVSVQ